MSRALKRLAAMKRNPKDDWTIDDVAQICRNFGVDCKSPAHGSHYVVSHPRAKGLLTVPFKRPIKPIYIILLVDLIECILEAK